jgi:hypothetical protein
MKTYVHLWQYLAEFFLEYKMFQIKCEEKTLTHILWDNVENYGMVGLAAKEDKILPMRCACWLYRAIDTHPEFVIMLFHSNKGYANKPHIT